MKEGWEIKKLGEVCDVIGGSTPKTSEESYWGGEHYWISPAELDGSKYVYSTSRTITDAGVKSAHLQVLPIGTVLLSSRAPIGKVAITKVPMYCNQGFKNLICKNEILNEYVYWFLLHNTEYLNSLGTGATFKEISKRVVEQVSIPVPPIAEQEKIVAELDCLSGIIEKKKQQLKEYDALAQSIFYEMFGDPVENEKGWEMKRLGDISEVTSFKRVLIEDVVETGIPFIRGTELSALSKLPNSKDYQFTLFITPDHYEKVKAISGVPAIGDLLIPSINSDGLILVLDTDEPRYYKDGRVLWIHTNHQYSDSKALKYIVSNKIRLMYNELASGATFIELKLFVLRDMLLPFPPLALQQDFASKIEAIEKQKALIKKSIEEVETLFNSRMEYYFN